MREYATKAVVLAKDTRNDADARYSFFTEKFGKVMAKAKSSRKIVSKLAGHLEPGTVVSVRIIETYGTQVVDALKIARADVSLSHLSSLNYLLPEWQPDHELWGELIRSLSQDAIEWTNVLNILGWDPAGASCMACQSGRPVERFLVSRQEFFCAPCASKYKPSELLLL